MLGAASIASIAAKSPSSPTAAAGAASWIEIEFRFLLRVRQKGPSRTAAVDDLTKASASGPPEKGSFRSTVFSPQMAATMRERVAPGGSFPSDLATEETLKTTATVPATTRQ